MPRGSKNPPNKGKGRKKGVPNKITRAFKDAVLNVFNKLGGEGHMLVWARENPTEYYKIAARLIPQEARIADQNGNALDNTITVNIVRPVIEAIDG